jgi:hypothetical protein
LPEEIILIIVEAYVRETIKTTYTTGYVAHDANLITKSCLLLVNKLQKEYSMPDDLDVILKYWSPWTRHCQDREFFYIYVCEPYAKAKARITASRRTGRNSQVPIHVVKDAALMTENILLFLPRRCRKHLFALFPELSIFFPLSDISSRVILDHFTLLCRAVL